MGGRVPAARHQDRDNMTHTPPHKQPTSWRQLALPLAPPAKPVPGDWHWDTTAPFALDDAPLVCPRRTPDEPCESCQ